MLKTGSQKGQAMKICDLHTHSTFSDGTFTPTELVRYAAEKGLSAVALTDHNTSKGLSEFMEAGRNYHVITVPGCEFTTDYEGTELHIVGLFFAEETWPEVEDYLELAHIAKQTSNTKMINNFRAAGYDITYEEAAALTDAEDFNRAHVARVLLAKGYVSSVKEAFDTVLKEGAGFYVPAKRLGALATIRFIKMYGAAAILAHPFLNLTYSGLTEFLPLAKEAGLDAIETRYSMFDEKTTEKAIELAQRFGLKQSGGSDFHGKAKPDIDLGNGRGTLCVPFSFYESLRPEQQE